jgi:hypothetical protein
MSLPEEQRENQPVPLEQASERQRLHELTRHLQNLEEVFDAFGEPDACPYCGIISARPLCKPQPRVAIKRGFFGRLLGRFRGHQELQEPTPPRWETVCEGPRWIYKRLSDTVDVHFGIDPAGRVAIKFFGKGAKNDAT